MPAKAKNAFRTISEVAAWLGVPAHVLRFWESKFPQIKPVKRAGGRRYYRPDDMRLIGGIKVLLHEQGITIRGVQKRIKDEGVNAISALSPDVNTPVATTQSKTKEPAVSEPAPSSPPETDRDNDTNAQTPDTNEDVSPSSTSGVAAIDPIADIHDSNQAVASNAGSEISGDHQETHAQQPTAADNQEPHLDASLEDQPEAFAVANDTRDVDVGTSDTPATDEPIDQVAASQADMFGQPEQEAVETQPHSFEAEPEVTPDPRPLPDDVPHEDHTQVSEVEVAQVATAVEEPQALENEASSAPDTLAETEEALPTHHDSTPVFDDPSLQSEPQTADAPPMTEEVVVTPILPPAPDLNAVSVPLSRLASLATITNLRRCNAPALGKTPNLKEIETKARALRISMADALRRASGA